MMSRRIASIAAGLLLLLTVNAHSSETGNRSSLRAAIQDLAATFGDRYPHAPAYLARLAALENRLDAAADEFRALRRESLLANPLVSGQPILFVVRRQYARDHHNTATFFPAAQHEYNDGRFQRGGAIKTIDVKTGQVRTLLDLPEGVVRDPEVHFDGRRILFSMRRDAKDSYHIYEIDADGGGLKQLTTIPDADDLDPLYLPDGSIAFSSTREPKYCACNRHIMANLFRANADGSNIHQIGKSTLFEGHGALMNDGRILYDRWEYVDRNFGDAQALWTCNPDGTNHAIYWGNNTPSPGGVIDGRPIPGSDRVVCVFGSCHDRPWGAIAIVDPHLGLDGKAPVVRTWPADAVDLVKDPGTANNAWDTFMQLKLKYEDPYPLSDASNTAAGKYFLCSRMTGSGEQTGIYLIDIFGNEALVHAEGPGCFDPMPLSPRLRPHAVPERRNFEHAAGMFYVQDVYIGTHMEGVKRGSVKSLRIIESPEKRFWTKPVWDGQGIEGPAMNWHDFGNKVILGTVPVEADGSAYFAVPAEKFVYFQLLDEHGMMIQSMRSGTMVQPGEKASCIGCHEDRRTAPPAGLAVPAALRRPPSPLEGWRGETRAFNYRRDVQPVFDRHCVSCHDYEHEPTAKIILAGDRGQVFNASYAELWSKRQLGVVGGGPAQTLQAYSWGAHASKLVQTIRKGHYDVKLDPDSFDRLVTWVDLNAPYYPSYATAHPDNPFGRSPLNNVQAKRLAELTGAKLNQPITITFDRPERSPSLGHLDKAGPQYAEALSIIRAGREVLANTPNPDADGFTPCPIDQWRNAKYTQRQRLEHLNRHAIRAGETRPDAPGVRP